MADWAAIRNSYIQNGGTYRQLAAKYGVPLRTLAARAKAEEWVKLKQQACNRAATLEVEAAARAKADLSARVYNAAGLMLEKVMEVSRGCKSAKDVRALTAAIKDIRDIAGIKSEADQAEQQARIEKLRRDAAGQDGDAGQSMTVALEGAMTDYAQ